jgi:cytosolic phospholipase A2
MFKNGIRFFIVLLFFINIHGETAVQKPIAISRTEQKPIIIEPEKKSTITTIAQKTASGIVAPFQVVYGLMNDATNYFISMVKNGIDATRTLNIAIARYRDALRTSYFVKADFKGFERDKQALNSAPTGSSSLLVDLFEGHKNQVAQVRMDGGLCDAEQHFIKQRMQYITQQFPLIYQGDIFKKAAEQNKVPRIAVCASGGGFRAMMATAGLIKALESTKIIDSVLFMSVLSGSTWVTIPRAMGKPIQALIDGYLKYAKLPLTVSPTALNDMVKNNPQMMPRAWETKDCLFPEEQEIRNNIIRKFYNDQPIDAMDIYGALIAHMILSPYDDPEIIKEHPNEDAISIQQTRQRVLYSQAAINLEGQDCGEFPLPIATAVSPITGYFNPSRQKSTKSKVQWFEFTPYEVGVRYYDSKNQLLGAFVPTWALGRRFEPIYEKQSGIMATLGLNRGKLLKVVSTENNSEYPLSYFLGIWGSAFAFSIKDLVRILGFDYLLAGANPLSPDAILKNIISLIVTAFAPITSLFSNVRFFPASVHNFMMALPDTSQSERTLTFVDAGIDFNLPFPPLLQKDRAVDIIIVLDASSPVFKKDKNGKFLIPGLQQAEAWAKAQSIPFAQITGSAALVKATDIDANNRASSPVTVFPGTNGAPTIIFIALIDNQASDKTEFKMKTCYEDHCNTFNFQYSPESVKGVVNHVERTVLDNLSIIKEAIEKVTAQKISAF